MALRMSDLSGVLIIIRIFDGFHAAVAFRASNVPAANLKADSARVQVEFSALHDFERLAHLALTIKSGLPLTASGLRRTYLAPPMQRGCRRGGCKLDFSHKGEFRVKRGEGVC